MSIAVLTPSRTANTPTDSAPTKAAITDRTVATDKAATTDKGSRSSQGFSTIMEGADRTMASTANNASAPATLGAAQGGDVSAAAANIGLTGDWQTVADFLAEAAGDSAENLDASAREAQDLSADGAELNSSWLNPALANVPIANPTTYAGVDSDRGAASGSNINHPSGTTAAALAAARLNAAQSARWPVQPQAANWPPSAQALNSDATQGETSRLAPGLGDTGLGDTELGDRGLRDATLATALGATTGDLKTHTSTQQSAASQAAGAQTPAALLLNALANTTGGANALAAPSLEAAALNADLTAPLSQTLADLRGAQLQDRSEGLSARTGEQMLSQLRQHLQLQIGQQQQQATIRLDPPELGALEIFITHEKGRLVVNISAAHADVARSLQQTSERLRQELVQQAYVEVNVNISQGQSGSDQQSPRAFAESPRDAIATGAELTLEDAPVLRHAVTDGLLVTV